MTIGKLYGSHDGKFLAEIKYRFFDESTDDWWGELTLTEYQRLNDGDGFMIELANGRRGKCFLKKKVNKAVQGFLPLYCYHFKGNGPLK
jgi:hypothetical protein|tara:strand:+ start:2688 stop:2954 length:267 start_codon:yes stop_codon:yes gene_type:complete